MVETLEQLAPKGNEPIAFEEVVNIGEDLEKNAQKPDKALALLKILDRKKITAELLTSTKIGKKLAPIADTPNPDVPELGIKHKRFCLAERAFRDETVSQKEVDVNLQKAQKARGRKERGQRRKENYQEKGF